MDENSAKKVFNSAQECLRLLNGMLGDAQQRIPKDEFAQLRLTTGNAMATIVEICEFHVYADYPDLRPYGLDQTKDWIGIFLVLALVICVNGEKYAVVGAKDWASLSADLLVYNSNDNTNILLNAGVHLEQTSPGEHHALRWRSKDLSIGDEVSIRIIDSPVVDKPDKKYRSDASVQESPFTDEEITEFQRQEYERLKKSFEQS